jgi:hypothetical protein
MKKIFSILLFLFLSFTIFSQPKIVEVKEFDKVFQGTWDKMYHSFDGGNTIISDYGVSGVFEVEGTKIISANGGVLHVAKIFAEKVEGSIINLVYFKEKSYIWRVITTEDSPFVFVFIYSHEKFDLKEIIAFKIERADFDGFNNELENL